MSAHLMTNRSCEDEAVASDTLVARAIFNEMHTSSLPVTSSDCHRPTLDVAYHITNAFPEPFLSQLDALRQRVPLDNSRPTCPRRFFQELTPVSERDSSLAEGEIPQSGDSSVAVAGDGRWERPIHYEDGWVTAGMNVALSKWMSQVGTDGGPPAGWRLEASPFYRILEYSEGGGMVRHSDGNNAHPSQPGVRTQFTMLAYLSTCSDGGGSTTLFRKKQKKKANRKASPLPQGEGAATCSSSGDVEVDDDDVIEHVTPLRNSVIIFPHVWPHAGCEVKCDDKIALRAELYLVEDTPSAS